MEHKLQIISGAYTHAEIASLHSAIDKNIVCTGDLYQHTPKKISDLFQHFTTSITHANKDMINISLADAVIMFKLSSEDPFEFSNSSSINFAINKQYKNIPLKYYGNTTEVFYGFKPIIIIWDLSLENYNSCSDDIIDFINLIKPSKLFISGSCMSDFSGYLQKYISFILDGCCLAY
jgi:hypothetical protein